MQREDRSYAVKLRILADITLILAIVALAIILSTTPLATLEARPSICIFKSLTGHDCPGCGITKALAAILQFKPNLAMQYNPKIAFVFPALTLILLRYFKRRLPTIIFNPKKKI